MVADVVGVEERVVVCDVVGDDVWLDVAVVVCVEVPVVVRDVVTDVVTVDVGERVAVEVGEVVAVVEVVSVVVGVVRQGSLSKFETTAIAMSAGAVVVCVLLLLLLPVLGWHPIAYAPSRPTNATTSLRDTSAPTIKACWSIAGAGGENTEWLSNSFRRSTGSRLLPSVTVTTIKGAAKFRKPVLPPGTSKSRRARSHAV